MKYRYILFDWDGNLAKTIDIWLRACRTALYHHGIAKTDAEIAASMGHILTTWEPWNIPNLEDVIQEVIRLGNRELPNAELYPGVIPLLSTLQDSGKTMALITSSTHNQIAHAINKYQVAQYFDAIIAADDVVNHKPHPEPLQKALAAIGGSANEAIMVGDSDKDLGAAKNAGIDSILFYPPEHQVFYNLDVLKKLKPTYLIDDLSKILDIV